MGVGGGGKYKPRREGVERGGWVGGPPGKSWGNLAGRVAPMGLYAEVGIGILRGISLLSAIRCWMISLDTLTIGYLMLDDTLPSRTIG